MEQDLDTPLFLRNGRKNVIATPQAEYLYEKALNLLDEWSTIASEIHTNTQHQSHCVLGISHTYAMALMPDLMIALYNAFPTVRFRVSMMNSAEVLTALEQHQLDLGIIEKPLSAPSILRFPILKDQLVLAGDPQAGPWLVREASSGVYYYTKRYLEEQSNAPINGLFFKRVLSKPKPLLLRTLKICINCATAIKVKVAVCA